MMRVVTAVVVVLVIVSGVILLRSNAGPGVVTSAPDTAPASAPPGAGASDQIVRPETHVIDLGEPNYLEDKFKDPNGKELVVLEKGVSHEGDTISFLHSPKWINKCNLDDIKEKAGKLAGLAIYNFDVKREDAYYVFLRAKWTDTCGNSVWVLMDGPEKGGHGPELKYDMIEDQEGYVAEKEYKVAWHPLKKAGEMKAFHLAAGPHRIELHTREDGPRFDQLVISTNANVPVGVAKKHD